MPAEAAAQVVRSRHSNHAESDIVVGHTGWRSHAVLPGNQLRRPADPSLCVTTALGLLGMRGFTAHVGVRLIAQTRPAETVAVAAATGPGGLTRRPTGEGGWRASSRDRRQPAEVRACEAEFRLRRGHRSPRCQPRRAVPPLLNEFARGQLRGLIAQYYAPQADARDQLPLTMRQILTRRLTVRGFINYDYSEYYPDFVREVAPAVATARIQCREDIVEGLEHAPEACIGMLCGRNFGKFDRAGRRVKGSR